MLSSTRVTPLVAIAWLALIDARQAAAQAQPTAGDIENSDVYTTLTELADEVELIREVMGRPFDDSGRLPMSGISETELYYQAETLLIGCNRLASELAGAELVYPPPVPRGSGVSFSVASTITASVPSEPTMRRVRS